ncbi:hypothetical protein BHE74_00023541 [Ensete ventricosum]|nr:hypothetical protein BHE74_00023541 [Ensete ventricosum]
MANQPPTARPWLRRLASQTRVEAQPAPPPRGPPIRQASLALGRAGLLPTRAPTQPAPAQTQPPPPPRPALTTTNGAAATSAVPTPQSVPSRQTLPSSPTPPQSPKVIKTSFPTPPRSPRTNLTQPPATPVRHLEPEPMQPKLAVEQGNANTRGAGNGAGNSRNSNHSNSMHDNMKGRAASPKTDEKSSATENGSAGKPATKKKENENENEMKGITIAGYNMGAYMDLGSSHGRQIGKQQLHHAKGESQTEDGNDTEGKTTKTASKQKPRISAVNSNVQSVNNSLLFNASCTQGSPGVHIHLDLIRRRRPEDGNSSTQKNHPSLR